MTSEERQAARARCEAATSGKWEVGPDSEDPRSRVIHMGIRSIVSEGQILHVEDAEFIAHARTDLPKALDEIDRLEACLLSLCGQIMALSSGTIVGLVPETVRLDPESRDSPSWIKGPELGGSPDVWHRAQEVSDGTWGKTKCGRLVSGSMNVHFGDLPPSPSVACVVCAASLGEPDRLDPESNQGAKHG